MPQLDNLRYSCNSGRVCGAKGTCGFGLLNSLIVSARAIDDERYVHTCGRAAFAIDQNPRTYFKPKPNKCAQA
jgi:hypothetical protein